MDKMCIYSFFASWSVVILVNGAVQATIVAQLCHRSHQLVHSNVYVLPRQLVDHHVVWQPARVASQTKVCAVDLRRVF